MPKPYIKKKDRLFNDYRRRYYHEISNINNLVELKNKTNQQIIEVNQAKKSDPMLVKNYLCREDRQEVLTTYRDAIEECQMKIRLIEYIEQERLSSN